LFYWPYTVDMYVATVPNRNSPPAILLRESFREGKQVKNRTLANLSDWEPAQVDALRAVLKGQAVGPLDQAFTISRSLPHGHVAAVLGTLRQLQLDSLLDPAPSRTRDLVSALIVSRILEPASKLATARALQPDLCAHSLNASLQLQSVSEKELYQAMDWLLERQPNIEQALAQRHLQDGSLVLYDLSSTYFEGSHCPLGKRGHSRDDKKDKLQIVFGLLTEGAGCPVAVEVFEGNTNDARSVTGQIAKLRERFQLGQVIVVGDRGTLTSARLREDFPAELGMRWITALRATQIRPLLQSEAMQLSLLDRRDLVEIEHADFPGERLVVCHNPLLEEERARKRQDLLAATERDLHKIVAATQRARRPLRGQKQIALRAGKVLGRYKMSKHFTVEIEETSFRFERKQQQIEEEENLDGFYVIRTNVAPERLSSQQVVESYKRLCHVEQAFRCLKTVDLEVRPIYHWTADRVRAHLLLCMLAYYVEWHMREKLAPLLFQDHDRAGAREQRQSPVAPAQRSPAAQRKAQRKRTDDDVPVHSFSTLLRDLATVCINHITPTMPNIPAFDMLTRPTELQQRAFDLLGVKLAL
jgi:transposase